MRARPADLPLTYVDALPPKMRREQIDKARAALLPPAEREAIVKELGEVVGPLLDERLEAKARELVDRYHKKMLSVFQAVLGDQSAREQWLVSREEAAKLLGVSLSTIKRMESSGDLPQPVGVGERLVRHRLLDIEAVARTKCALVPD